MERGKRFYDERFHKSLSKIHFNNIESKEEILWVTNLKKSRQAEVIACLFFRLSEWYPLFNELDDLAWTSTNTRDSLSLAIKSISPASNELFQFLCKIIIFLA